MAQLHEMATDNPLQLERLSTNLTTTKTDFEPWSLVCSNQVPQGLEFGIIGLASMG